MSNSDYVFWAGFLVAGLIGVLGDIVSRNWNNIQRTQRLMFTVPPKPVTKNLGGATYKRIWGIGTDPDQSPLAVLNRGCLSIMGNGIFSGLIMGVMGVIIGWVFLLPEIPPDAWNGVMFAAVVGIFLRRFRYHWKQITNLYAQIVNPPVPITRDFDPPNGMVLAAKPDAPAFTIVIKNSRNIGLHLLAILLFFIGFLFIVAWLFGDELSMPAREFGV